MRPAILAPGLPPPWSGFLSDPRPGDHLLQLYRDDGRLVDVVSLFAGAGLLEGDAVVLVATPPHVDAVTRRLVAAGFDVDAVRRWGQLWVFDAATLLSRFLRNGVLDADAFDAIVGRTLDEARAAARGRRVRVFGEMVDLLWKQNLEATRQLEELWNTTVEAHSVSLLCSYRFEPEARSPESFPLSLHEAHSHHIPLEAST
jgi:KaiC/GvpD/RAD55 family RecA-like ATPase